MFSRLFDQDLLLFSIPATFGTALFLLRVALMAIGGEIAHGDTDADLGDGSDVSDGHDGDDSTSSFKLLSLQAIAAFLMGFGWGGLGARLGLDWSLWGSLLLGCAFGAALVWLLAAMLRIIYSLQSSGNINAQRAVGCEGTVYARIPEKTNGTGQVRVVIDERARIYTAVSSGAAIDRNARIRVTAVGNDRTLVVQPA